MKRLLVSFVVLAFVLGAFLAYVSLATDGSGATQPQLNVFIDSTTYPSSVSSTDSENHLELNLAISSTTVYPGEWNSIFVSENNTLATGNNVSASDDWAVRLPALGCFGQGPVGFGVFPGFYSAQNITEASSELLALGNGNYPTVCFAIANESAYDFAPNSNFFGSSGCLSYCNVSLGFGFAFNATLTETPTGPGFVALSPGVYTVVAADEWGQLLILHFGVCPVQVSIAGPLTSNNSLGPRVLITVVNAGTEPIVELNASLRIESQFSFASSYGFSFPVDPSNPLVPGGALENSETLQGAGLSSGQSYHVTISAELESGMRIVYIQALPISPPV